MIDRRRFSLRALILSYLAGVAMFLVAVAMMVGALYAAIDALDRETENRLARQVQQDGRLMLKLPALQKRLKTEDCYIKQNQLVCLHTNKQGKLFYTTSE